MLSYKDLLDTTAKRLREAFPERPVYIEFCPQRFKRPSFLLELIRTGEEEGNLETVVRTVYLTITCFEETNDYYNTAVLQMIQTQETVQRLFRSGFLQVEDRAIKVKASAAGSNPNEAYIELTLEYFDDRTDGSPAYETMQELSVTIKKED